MFNLLKRAVNPQKVIQQIHNEFDTAGDRLLKQAESILSKSTDTSKAERLKKLGFASAGPVSRANTYKDQKEKSYALAQRIEYFRTYYPNNKFITQEMVKTICTKYGLVCGSIALYLGDVPLKNIEEMEAFKLREEDFSRFKCGMLFNHWLGTKPFWGYTKRDGQTPYHCPKEKMEHTEQEPFEICAPEKDFNTAGMSKRDVFLVPDPIVLQPVDGGFLIVSKWGLEASDELAVNHAHN